MTPRVRKTSPCRRRARKTNSIWRWVSRSTWTAGGRSTFGGSRRGTEPSCNGPAGDGGASSGGGEVTVMTRSGVTPDDVTITRGASRSAPVPGQQLRQRVDGPGALLQAPVARPDLEVQVRP